MLKCKKQVFVIGHKNPDMDSVSSAIGYAYLKSIIDKENVYIPARSGDLNDETKFALERFDVERPMRMENLTPTIGDMELKNPSWLHPEIQ